MRLEHPIFHGPLAAELDAVKVARPDHYLQYEGGDALPAELDAWLVQKRAFPDLQPGLVADPFGFEDSPDCEWISGGINSKGPTSMALGRQANLFMWGFQADPRDLTRSGRRVFVNSLVYIAGFDDARPLVGRVAPARERVFTYMHYVRERREHERTQQIVEDLFPAEVLEACEWDADRLTEWYRRRLEYLRRADGRFVVDDELERRGLSNRSLELLDAIASRLADDPTDALATQWLEAYVDPAIAPRPADFGRWLAGRRETLFFSDTGGFRWFSSRVPSTPETLAEHPGFQAGLTARPRVLPRGATSELRVELELDAGWHTYAPDSPGGFPLGLEVEWPAGIEALGDWLSPPARVVEDDVLGTQHELEGRVALRHAFRVTAECTERDPIVRAKLRVVACDATSCLPVREVELSLALRVDPD